MEDVVAGFRGTYARMDDAQLAHLLAARGELLSSEARLALTQEIQTRDPGGFARELDAVRRDETQWQQAETARSHRIVQSRRRGQKVINWFLAWVVLGGILIALVDAESGIAVAAIGALFWLITRAGYLVRRFIAALFRHD